MPFPVTLGQRTVIGLAPGGAALGEDYSNCVLVWVLEHIQNSPGRPRLAKVGWVDRVEEPRVGLAGPMAFYEAPPRRRARPSSPLRDVALFGRGRCDRSGGGRRVMTGTQVDGNDLLRQRMEAEELRRIIESAKRNSDTERRRDSGVPSCTRKGAQLLPAHWRGSAIDFDKTTVGRFRDFG